MVPIFYIYTLNETCINQLHKNEKLPYQITYYNPFNSYNFLFSKN